MRLDSIALIMGATDKIWNPVQVAEQARNDYASEIFPSRLSIDPSLSLSQMTPLVMFVTLFPFSLFFFDVVFFSTCMGLFAFGC